MSRKEKARMLAKRLRALRRKKRAEDVNRLQSQEALGWLFDKSIFSGVILHGNTTWTCFSLVALTFLWALSDAPQLTHAFSDARAQLYKLNITCTITTYQGLMKALTSVTPQLLPIVKRRFRSRLVQIGKKHLRVGQWVPIAFDGSKETVPRSISNELAFLPPNYGQGKNAKNRKRKNPKKRTSVKATKPALLPPPQVWLTMMCHVTLGVPWCWKLGPSNSSERNHVRALLKSDEFLANTLFIGDAGFVGYDFWTDIISAGHNFMVRVGANVTLLEGLTHEGKNTVACWPDSAKKAGLPPLKLRCVQCKLGKSKVWLLTSVLDEKQLSKVLMLDLYKKRWGIEVLFRDFKQTFNKGKLRCRDSHRALLELEWAIVTMAAVKLCALREQLQDPKAEPEALSFSKSLNAFRNCFNNIHDLPDFMDELETELKGAVVDSYNRKSRKAGRYKPKRKRPPSCGQPIIVRATKDQRKCASQCLQNAA